MMNKLNYSCRTSTSRCFFRLKNSSMATMHFRHCALAWPWPPAGYNLKTYFFTAPRFTWSKICLPLVPIQFLLTSSSLEKKLCNNLVAKFPTEEQPVLVFTASCRKASSSSCCCCCWSCCWTVMHVGRHGARAVGRHGARAVGRHGARAVQGHRALAAQRFQECGVLRSYEQGNWELTEAVAIAN